MVSKKQDHPITIKQDDKKPIPTEVIAEAIVQISDAVKKLNNSKLKPRVVHLLIKDMTGVPLGMIETVLNAAQSLEKNYIK